MFRDYSGLEYSGIGSFYSKSSYWDKAIVSKKSKFSDILKDNKINKLIFESLSFKFLTYINHREELDLIIKEPWSDELIRFVDDSKEKNIMLDILLFNQTYSFDRTNNKLPENLLEFVKKLYEYKIKNSHNIYSENILAQNLFHLLGMANDVDTIMYFVSKSSAKELEMLTKEDDKEFYPLNFLNTSNT